MIEEFCNRAFSALLNGACQGILLAVMVLLLLRLARGSNAATRHGVALVTLLVVTSLPVVHYFNSPGKKASLALRETPGMVIRPTKVTAPESLESQSPPPLSGPVQLGIPPALAGSNPGDESRLDSAWPRLSRELELALPAFLGVVVVLLWMGLAAVRLTCLGWQHARFCKLKAQGASACPAVQDLFAQLCKELELRRKPRLLTSAEIGAPMLLGFINPAILLPVQLVEQLGETQLESILRHELAHVERGDDWTNLFQQIALALFFFHPAVRWLSRRLILEREIACDDHVLAAGGNPRGYALFLTEFASRMRRRDWTAAPAAWSNRNQLKERIVMILDTGRNNSPRLARGRAGIYTLGAVALACLAFQAGPRLAIGQESPGTAPAVLENASPQSLPTKVSDKKTEDISLEQRMERLERLVESLVASEKQKAPAASIFQASPTPSWNGAADLDKRARTGLSEEQMARIQAQAQKAAEQAALMMQRASDQYERALKHIKDPSRLDQPSQAFKGQPGFPREQFEMHRQAIQKQMEALHQQIESLKAEQEKLLAEQERMQADQVRTLKQKDKRNKLQKSETLKPAKVPPPPAPPEPEKPTDQENATESE